MNVALPELLQALEGEAATEAAALRDAARADAARIRAEAAARRERRVTDELARHAAAERAANDAEVAAAARGSRRAVLEARAAALARLHGAVTAVLPEVDGRFRLDLLEAARRLGGEGAVLEHTVTGVRATRGDVVIDATLEAILARLWPRLRLEAAP
jgi:vacuolar-type H+-ATPase subunit E/Vma4